MIKQNTLISWLYVPYMALCPISDFMSDIPLYVPYMALCPISHFMSHIPLYVPYLTLCPISHFMSHIWLYVPYPTLCPISHFMSDIPLYVPYPTLCPISDFMSDIWLYVPYHTLCPIYDFMSDIPRYVPYHTLCPISDFMSHISLYVLYQSIVTCEHFDNTTLICCTYNKKNYAALNLGILLSVWQHVLRSEYETVLSALFNSTIEPSRFNSLIQKLNKCWNVLDNHYTHTHTNKLFYTTRHPQPFLQLQSIGIYNWHPTIFSISLFISCTTYCMIRLNWCARKKPTNWRNQRWFNTQSCTFQSVIFV